MKTKSQNKTSFLGEGFVSIVSIFIGIYTLYINYNIFSDSRELYLTTNIYRKIYIIFQIILILYCISVGYRFYKTKKRFLYYNSIFLILYAVIIFLEFILKTFYFNIYLNILLSKPIIGLHIFIGILSGYSFIINGLFMLKYVKSEYYKKAFIVSILLILNSIIGLFFYLYFLYDTSFYLDIILESLLLISGITFFIGVPLFLYSGIFLIIGKLRNKMK